MLVCFKGINGCGKDTQISLLKKRLESCGASVAVIKQPGHTEFGREIRKLILDGKPPGADLARRLLFWADFTNSVHQLPEVDVVTLNRHARYSNYAYGVALGSDPAALLSLEAVMSRYVKVVPDITFIIDVPGRVAFQRLQARGKLTWIEEGGPEFLESVRQAYLWAANRYPEARILSGKQPPEEIQELVKNCLWRLVCTAG